MPLCTIFALSVHYYFKKKKNISHSFGFDILLILLLLITQLSIRCHDASFAL